MSARVSGVETAKKDENRDKSPLPMGPGACRMCSWPDPGMEIAALYKARPLREQLGPVTKCGGGICFKRVLSLVLTMLKVRQ